MLYESLAAIADNNFASIAEVRASYHPAVTNSSGKRINRNHRELFSTIRRLMRKCFHQARPVSTCGHLWGKSSRDTDSSCDIICPLVKSLLLGYRDTIFDVAIVYPESVWIC